MSGPETGFVTLGHATQELSQPETQPAESITARLRDALFGSGEPAVDEITALNAVETTVRQAVRGRLTIDCERDSTSRGLLVFAGPPRWLHRDAIAKQQAWVQDELACPELRSGDTPTPETQEIAAVLVMSGVDEIPRLSELSSLAADASNDSSGQ